jgi:hypothetical protein
MGEGREGRKKEGREGGREEIKNNKEKGTFSTFKDLVCSPSSSRDVFFT